MWRYPTGAAARSRFVLDRRAPRTQPDPWRAPEVAIEDERMADGAVRSSATVFLTGRECPWRCVMCDLWTHTTTTDTPPGAIADQVATARQTLARSDDRVAQMKLYNAGSFFDPRAVPDQDYPAIAASLAGLDRVVVESHPSLVGARTWRFLDALARGTGAPSPALEVAMGLETAHPTALDHINKRMTVDDFARAAGRLRQRGADVRVFLLVSPPFVPADEQDVWLLRSIDVALACGASAVSLVPTRPGNGALDVLAGVGAFHPPALADLERSLALALEHVRPRHSGTALRVFADLWDLDRFAACAHCLDARRARLREINLRQCVPPPVLCSWCGADADA